MSKKLILTGGGLLLIGLIYLGFRISLANDFFSSRGGEPGQRETVDSGNLTTKSRLRGLVNDRTVDSADDLEEIEKSLKDDDEIPFELLGDLANGRDLPSELRDEFLALSEAERGSGKDAELIRSISSQWTAINPGEAVEWAFRLPDGLAQVALSEIARSAEPDSLAELFQTVNHAGNNGDARVRNYGLAVIMHKWGEIAPQDAWKAASSIKDDLTKARVYSDIATSFAEIDPSSAAEHLILAASLYAAESEEQELLKPAFGMVAGSMAGESMQAALDWVNSLEEGPAKEEATRSLAIEYFNRDPHKASEWVTNLPEGQARDKGITSLIAGTRDDDPLVRMAWASIISDKDLKEDMQVEVGFVWSLTDEVGFKNWLETSEGQALDGRVKSAILDEPEQ